MQCSASYSVAIASVAIAITDILSDSKYTVNTRTLVHQLVVSRGQLILHELTIKCEYDITLFLGYLYI